VTPTPAIRLSCHIVATALLASLLQLSSAVADVPAPNATASIPAINHTVSNYLQSCGGCHGIQGTSAIGLVPQLRDRVGWFLCTPDGRNYIVQLPDVAFAGVSDQELADVLNFMMFELGGPSTPKSAKPYSAAEVKQLRENTPLRTGVHARRQAVVTALVKTCGADPEIAKPEPGY
jgi:mono/diheme cytochrome c family protein